MTIKITKIASTHRGLGISFEIEGRDGLFSTTLSVMDGKVHGTKNAEILNRFTTLQYDGKSFERTSPIHHIHDEDTGHTFSTVAPATTRTSFKEVEVKKWGILDKETNEVYPV